MKRTTIGLDIAKRVFQAHAVDPDSGEVRRTKLQRTEVLRYFAQLRPSLGAVEACGSVQDPMAALARQASLSDRSVQKIRNGCVGRLSYADLR